MVAVAAIAALAACGDTRDQPTLIGSGADAPAVGAAPGATLPDTPAAPAGAGASVAVGIVQVAAFGDGASAMRLRDSLAAAGWDARVARVTPDSLPGWRVRVAPLQDPELLQLVAAGWRTVGGPVQIVGDSATPSGPRVRVHRVNRGTHGMRADTRWTLSRDRRAIVVVEDPVSIEGDPLPDGFLYAAEGRPGIIQRDSVWDVAPDPTWRRIAYGRAFLVRREGREEASAMGWLTVAARTNMEVAVIRRRAFPVSGMSAIEAFAQPVIEPLAADSADASLARRVAASVPMFGGWRVRWSTDGTTLAVGLPPTRAVADDAAPSTWAAVDARSLVSRGEVQSYMRLASIDWTAGPTFDVASRVDGAARRLPIAGGEVRSANGWVTVEGPATGGARRVIGPGSALVATAGGRFVVALVPAAALREGEPAVELVVYEIAR